MSPALLDAILVVAALALFAGAYLVAMLATRPARVSAAAATPDLGEEPPAVVNLLANRWQLTPDAAEATLLDLAAKGLLEIRQPADDPMQTTIHLRHPDQPPELLPYERRVLIRVQDLAVQGVVPVTALSFRNQARAKQWTKRLQHEVVADARARGLSRRRVSGAVIGALVSVAAFSSLWVTVAAGRWAARDDEAGLVEVLIIGLVAFAAMSGIAARPAGDRDTSDGQRVAARWLGVGEWLRGHEEFADLPPAAVAVWDRYLSYGAALGVTHTTSEVLDLGLSDRKLVWSSYGGPWRRVRVRYPKVLPRYGNTLPGLLVRGTVAVVVGALLLGRTGVPQMAAPGPLDTTPLQAGPGGVFDVLAWHLAWLGAVLLAYGAYTVLRTLLDLVITHTVTGEVLWIEPWKYHNNRHRSRPSRPWLHYLAVDDGKADRTTAWGLPHRIASDVIDRDIVTVRARPWTRRVVDLTVVEHGRSRRLRDAPVEAVDGHGSTDVVDTSEGLTAFKTAISVLTGTPGSKLGVPGAEAEQLLTADEVGRALGVAVRGPRSLPVPEPLANVAFDTVAGGRRVLTVGFPPESERNTLWTGVEQCTALPGIGDDAYLDGDRGVVRVGAAIAVITLVGHEGQAGREHLPWLLHQAAGRVPRQRGHDGQVSPAPGA